VTLTRLVSLPTIRIYLPNEHFPAGGKMTMGFNELVVGDCVEIKGPFGSFIWERPGMAFWKGARRAVKRIGLVCGGSGASAL
jgi:nitrate reductase (NAD(P)H)